VNKDSAKKAICTLGYNPKGIIHANRNSANIVCIVWKDREKRNIPEYYSQEMVYKITLTYDEMVKSVWNYQRFKKLNRILNECNK